MIKEIMNTVTIPVMAKCRIGHFAEAQILEALEVDMIDESEGKCRSLVAFSKNASILNLVSYCRRRNSRSSLN